MPVPFNYIYIIGLSKIIGVFWVLNIWLALDISFCKFFTKLCVHLLVMLIVCLLSKMVALAYVDAMFFLTAIANGILSISLIGFFSPKVGV